MVYVDNARIPYRKMLMCHMIADTTEELLAMAEKIGVQRKWIQDAGTVREHFDVCLVKRAKAIQNGTVELTRREFYHKLIEKEQA